MLSQTLEQSPRHHRGGQVSFLLLGKGQFGSQNLAITWVEGAPESEQPSHSHPANEQAYVIVRGRGLMMAGDEAQEVGPGTIVLIPPNTSHSIRNIGEEPLVYVSATSPPFEMPRVGNTSAYTPPP
ncbi:MAG: cupin domain-containing protein [Dehalococcoidia bacterium]